jgi:hypothetical protein
MPGHQSSSGEIVGRREGRRSLSAYLGGRSGRAHSRGAPGFTASDRRRGSRTSGAALLEREGSFSAASALALVYPLLRARRLAGISMTTPHQQRSSEGAGCMKRKPTIKSLETVSLEEAHAYLDYANGDELGAAYELALDRNRLDGSAFPPDDAEVHHAYFLLSRARGLLPPSFDAMRVELRRRAAA